MRWRVAKVRASQRSIPSFSLAELACVLVFPGVEPSLGGYRCSLWANVVAAAVLAGLAVWMWSASSSGDE
jgi:hypothetical protein